jgi:hypothetical protein
LLKSRGESSLWRRFTELFYLSFDEINDLPLETHAV